MIAGRKPRSESDPTKATDAEILASWRPFAAQSGTYEISGTTVTTLLEGIEALLRFFLGRANAAETGNDYPSRQSGCSSSLLGYMLYEQYESGGLSHNRFRSTMRNRPSGLVEAFC